MKKSKAAKPFRIKDLETLRALSDPLRDADRRTAYPRT
jgi:hypothetical protein